MSSTHTVSPSPSGREPRRNGRQADSVEAKVSADRKWWREQWLAFPTVSESADGGFEFWDVAPDTGVYQDDWPRGERLARDTIAHMQRFPEGASVLRRILARIDSDSTVAQGFVNRIEDALARPDLYLTPIGTTPPRGH